MIAAGVDENRRRLSRDECVHMRRATGIISFIVRHRPRRDDDQAVAGMRVPPGASSWLPHTALHDKVGQPLRFLQRQPNVAVVSRVLGERWIDQLVEDVHLPKPALRQRF